MEQADLLYQPFSGPWFRQVPPQGWYEFPPGACENSRVNTDWMLDKAMNKFAFGNADKKGVYFDEENRRHLNSIRTAYTALAIDLSKRTVKMMLKK
jgi:hypothetical protein